MLMFETLKVQQDAMHVHDTHMHMARTVPPRSRSEACSVAPSLRWRLTWRMACSMSAARSCSDASSSSSSTLAACARSCMRIDIDAAWNAGSASAWAVLSSASRTSSRSTACSRSTRPVTSSSIIDGRAFVASLSRASAQVQLGEYLVKLAVRPLKGGRRR